MLPQAVAPLDLLRELRKVFEYDAFQHRKNAQTSFSKSEQQAAGAKAYACEKAVEKIDATLRDWA